MRYNEISTLYRLPYVKGNVQGRLNCKDVGGSGPGKFER
jgi:hypothetical protein